jgi:hypothetical protein
VIPDDVYQRAEHAKQSLRAFVVSFASSLSPAGIARVVELVEANEPDVAVTELAWMLESAGYVPDVQLAAEFRRLAPAFPADDDWPPHFR